MSKYNPQNKKVNKGTNQRLFAPGRSGSVSVSVKMLKRSNEQRAWNAWIDFKKTQKHKRKLEKCANG